MEEKAHVHTEQCYETVLVCGMEAHVHDLWCYADPQADLKTPDIWRRTLPELTGNWKADLLAVARSQLGYRESSRNYIVGADDRIEGYTRYGAWVRAALWGLNAAFAAFCLRYANIPSDVVPSDADCAAWMSLLQSADYEVPTRERADFPDDDADAVADWVGILTDVSVDSLEHRRGRPRESWAWGSMHRETLP